MHQKAIGVGDGVGNRSRAAPASGAGAAHEEPGSCHLAPEGHDPKLERLKEPLEAEQVSETIDDDED
jgi:hypothetical protein